MKAMCIDEDRESEGTDPRADFIFAAISAQFGKIYAARSEDSYAGGVERGLALPRTRGILTLTVGNFEPHGREF